MTASLDIREIVRNKMLRRGYHGGVVLTLREAQRVVDEIGRLRELCASLKK